MSREHSANNNMETNTIQSPEKPVAAVVVGSRPWLGSVFELSESDERHDTYYTLGFYRTLADAIAEVEKRGVSLCTVAMESQESACVEIHEHPLNEQTMRGQPVWTRRWIYDYEREHGDRWQVPSLPNT